MEIAGYTNGPWEMGSANCGGGINIFAGDIQVAFTCEVNSLNGKPLPDAKRIGSGQAMANGKLIAAAPDLLKCLQQYMKAVDTMQKAMNDGVNVQGALMGFSGAHDMALYAIAKATGQEPQT